MRTATWVLAAVLMLATLPADAQAPAPREEIASILLRAGPTKAGARHLTLLRDLMRVAEPTSEDLDAGADVRLALRQHCGEARPEELQLLRQLNPTLTNLVLDAPMTVRIPPCPYWTGPVTVTVPKGSAVADVMHISMGASGPKSLALVQKLNPDVDLSRVRAGQEITLPYATRSVSYRLKSQFQDAPAAAVPQLQSLNARVISEVRLVRPVALTGQMADCSAVAALPRWPFDAARLAEILRQNDAARAAPARYTVAAVADTGIAKNEARLPLERSRNESDDPEHDLDGNRHFGDVIGVNLATSAGFPEADPRDLDAKHGTHVAALVAGQTMPGDLPALAAAAIHLKILNLQSLIAVLPDRNGGEPQAIFSIPPDGLRHALTYAMSQRATVLNLSVESSVPIDDFRGILGDSPLLTVAAAGNSMLDLDQPGVRAYPALYRRERPEKFITVAAHGPDGKLAWFSNHGSATVDLAAPGVCIDSLVPGSRERLNGTSQAAPIVSFTAALLAAEGMTPAAIKRRIMSTVDIDRTLNVASEGRLNVLKAAACYDDQLEVEGRGWLRGRFAAGTTVTVGGQAVNASKVARVLPRYASDARPTKVFYKDDDNRSETAVLPTGGVSFEVLGASQSESFSWDRIVDFIPRDCQR